MGVDTEALSDLNVATVSMLLIVMTSCMIQWYWVQIKMIFDLLKVPSRLKREFCLYLFKKILNYLHYCSLLFCYLVQGEQDFPRLVSKNGISQPIIKGGFRRVLEPFLESSSTYQITRKSCNVVYREVQKITNTSKIVQSNQLAKRKARTTGTSLKGRVGVLRAGFWYWGPWDPLPYLGEKEAQKRCWARSHKKCRRKSEVFSLIFLVQCISFTKQLLFLMHLDVNQWKQTFVKIYLKYIEYICP